MKHDSIGKRSSYVVLTDAILKRYGLTEAGTSAVVPLLGKIQGVKAWAIFVEQEDGHYRIRLRSKGPFINELAKKHQGGGHPLASGAKLVMNKKSKKWSVSWTSWLPMPNQERKSNLND